MVRYYDPEEHPEGREKPKRRRQSPGERLARMRERNAALEGVQAVESAREVALRKLDKRACSRAELEQAIIQRGFEAELATHVVDRLEAVGLVDDAAFAHMIVKDRFALRGNVGRAVTQELQRKGIAQEHIDAAMELISGEDEYERALELAQRKVRSIRGLSREKAWSRLSGMLARKGYSPGVASRVLREVLAGWGSDSWDEKCSDNGG